MLYCQNDDEEAQTDMVTTTVTRQVLEERKAEVLHLLESSTGGGEGVGVLGRRATPEERDAQEELDEIEFLLGA